MSIYTGEYFEHTDTGILGSVYYTFTPKPLADGDFYTADEELFNLLIGAHRVLGILEGLLAHEPDAAILKELFLHQESSCSYRIDYLGNDSFPYLDSHGCKERLSAISNIKSAYVAAADMKISVSALTDIYRIVRYGSEADVKSHIRTKPMFLTNAVTNLRQYSPTAPAHLAAALQDMLLYLRQSPSDILIKTALSHYQFEMLHPFECYNGIVGRILAQKVMLDSGIKVASYIALSEYLCATKGNYFDLLAATQKGGGYVSWIKYFTHAVLSSAKHRVEQVEQYVQIAKHDAERIQEITSYRTDNLMKVYEYWKRHLVAEISQPVAALQLSYTTVMRCVQVLQEIGILKQITKTRRHRRFAYTDLASLFVEPNR